MKLDLESMSSAFVFLTNCYHGHSRLASEEAKVGLCLFEQN